MLPGRSAAHEEHFTGKSGLDLPFPPHLHDWVVDDHPARVFSDLVDRLRIAGFQDAAVEGRPRYDTRMMLKVLLWAYANGTRASRKIEERLLRCCLYVVVRTPDS